MKRKSLKIYMILIICIVIALAVAVFYQRPLFKKDLYKLSDIKSNKVMIVAHPDDDVLWGGAALIKEDYLVVCITCGSDEKRVTEFKNVMKATNDEYIMLGYPDKTNGKRSSWEKEKKDIIKDLKKIINSRDWNLVITHNPDGEYGHEHHKMTSKFVTSLVKHSKLYYFGHYYQKDKIPNNLKKIDSESYKKKADKIIPLYISQKKVTDKFKHMWEYENWIDYYSW